MRAVQLLASFFIGLNIAAGAAAAPAEAQDVPFLRLMAETDYQWTSVAVSSDGRVFVCFPTRTEFPSFHVAELRGGVPVSFPDQDTNANFSNVNSIYIDKQDFLWVLDSGVPAGRNILRRSPRVLQISLRLNALVRTYEIPDSVLQPGSQLADIVVDSKTHTVFISDGGAGGLIALDTVKDRAALLLDRSVREVMASASFLVSSSGKYYPRMPNINGIALSEDRSKLYFAPLIGTRMYSIAMSDLLNKKLSMQDRRNRIRTYRTPIAPTSGMSERNGHLFFGDLIHEKMVSLDLAEDKLEHHKFSYKVRWADDFFTDAKGSVWFIDSESNVPTQKRAGYRLYKIQWLPAAMKGKIEAYERSRSASANAPRV